MEGRNSEATALRIAKDEMGGVRVGILDLRFWTQGNRGLQSKIRSKSEKTKIAGKLSSSRVKHA
jgi:hypothetical protein